MHLVYIDESGNSGVNLNDPQQPLFLLCAMIVDEQRWDPLDQDLQSVLAARVPRWQSMDGFEVHAADLRCGTGFFKGMSVSDRMVVS